MFVVIRNFHLKIELLFLFKETVFADKANYFHVEVFLLVGELIREKYRKQTTCTRVLARIIIK